MVVKRYNPKDFNTPTDLAENPIGSGVETKEELFSEKSSFWAKSNYLSAPNAWLQIHTYLESGEELFEIVIGPWATALRTSDNIFEHPEPEEPEPLLIPLEVRNKILLPEEAEKYLTTWKIDRDRPDEFYRFYAWTDRRVIWVEVFENSPFLCSVNRHARVPSRW